MAIFATILLIRHYSKPSGFVMFNVCEKTAPKDEMTKFKLTPKNNVKIYCITFAIAVNTSSTDQQKLQFSFALLRGTFARSLSTVRSHYILQNISITHTSTKGMDSVS